MPLSRTLRAMMNPNCRSNEVRFTTRVVRAVFQRAGDTCISQRVFWEAMREMNKKTWNREEEEEKMQLHSQLRAHLQSRLTRCTRFSSAKLFFFHLHICKHVLCCIANVHWRPFNWKHNDTHFIIIIIVSLFCVSNFKRYYWNNIMFLFNYKLLLCYNKENRINILKWRLL